MKIFWATSQLELPPLMHQPDHCNRWMEAFMFILQQPLPPNPPTDWDLALQWAPWKLKKRVAQILHRLQQRFGNPKRRSGAVNSEQDGTLRFAQEFQAR